MTTHRVNIYIFNYDRVLNPFTKNIHSEIMLNDSLCNYPLLHLKSCCKFSLDLGLNLSQTSLHCVSCRGCILVVTQPSAMLVIQLKSGIRTDKVINKTVKFKKNSSFFLFLKENSNIKQTLIQEQEIWDLLCSISHRHINQDIICLNRRIQRILKIQYIHRNDLIEVLKPHLIFTEDTNYKNKLRYQKPKIKNIASLVQSSDIFDQLKIRINKALLHENINTQFLISDELFKSMALKIKTFQKTLPSYTFFYIRQLIGKYIVENQSHLLDPFNNKIAHVAQDEFFKPFDIKIFHVSQLNDFIFLHLKPYKHSDISNFCAFYYNH